jgi:choice-of-anchor B domain-containing protein
MLVSPGFLSPDLHPAMLGITSALLAFAALPQADGVTLLAKVQPGANCNDVWGYTAPNGDEYALVGTATGTSIYNCTNPTAPYLTAAIAGPPSVWRDMKTYGPYAYAVTESAGGIQIIDLNDPENPSLVKTWAANRFSSAHNISIDTGTGKIYVSGTSNGTQIFDAAVDPTSPPYITTYNTQYVHDMHVQNGYAHNAEIFDGRYRILDVSNLPSMPTKDRIQTPGRFTHSAWANETDTLCITTDEVNGGRVALYDISNKTNIQYLDEWTADSSTIPHNAFIIGDKAYISWYTEGFICLDLSDPNNLKKFASYDTSPFSSGTGFHGAWGCYPFSPSGVVYITDIEEGFYILKVEGPAIDLEHTALGNTNNEVGPYPVTVTADPVHAGSTVTEVDVWYRVEKGSWQNFALTQAAATNQWTGDFPGQQAPAVIEYYVHASETGGRSQWLPASSAPGGSTYSFYVGDMVEIYFNDFEGTDDEGWTHGATVGFDDFERGVPQGRNGVGNRHQGVRWYDPSYAKSGNLVWGNDLGTNNTDGAYNENASMWLQSPPIDCTNSARSTLVFDRWLSVEGQSFDRARIWVNNDLVWLSPANTGESVFVSDVDWTQMVINISDYADGLANVVVRFELDSDSAMSLGGWGIDDFQIIALEPGEPIDTITLTGPAMANVNDTVQYDFSGAPANSTYRFLRSFSDLGSLQFGHNFDLGDPIFLVDTGVSNGQGEGSFSATLPSQASGMTFYLEVGAIDSNGVISDSNMLTLLVN